MKSIVFAAAFLACAPAFASPLSACNEAPNAAMRIASSYKVGMSFQEAIKDAAAKYPSLNRVGRLPGTLYSTFMVTMTNGIYHNQHIRSGILYPQIQRTLVKDCRNLATN